MNDPSPITWAARPFAQLDARLLHHIIKLRVDVFVVEQHCPYPELDGLDLDAWHITGQRADGSVAAYARVLPPGPDGIPHVGRVVVAASGRGHGTGKQLMEEVLGLLRRQYGSARSRLAAQAHLLRFYGQLGYAPISSEYLLDDIPHVDMERGQ